MGGREGGREAGRKGGREGGREGEREEGGREGGRDQGEREIISTMGLLPKCNSKDPKRLVAILFSLFTLRV